MDIFKLLITCLNYSIIFLVCLVAPSLGQECQSSSDCQQSRGEVCLASRLAGCPIGACRCPHGMRKNRNGICRKVVPGGASCGPRVVCRAGVCMDGRCRCQGKAMLISRGSVQYCKPANERFLGEPCIPGQHTCRQLSGSRYITNYVECSPRGGRCECAAGYKMKDDKCQQLENCDSNSRLVVDEDDNVDVDDEGCTIDENCHGGALCHTGTSMCRCPPEYQPVAGNTKCAPIAANTRIDLGEGATCDEYVKADAFCRQGLVCLSCGDAKICSKVPEQEIGVSGQASRTAVNLAVIYTLCTLSIITLLLQRSGSTVIVPLR